MVDCLGYEVGTPGKDCSVHDRSPGDFAARCYSYEAHQRPLGYLPFVTAASPRTELKAALAAARREGVLNGSRRPL